MKGNFFYQRLGKKIHFERIKRKLSQEQLAFLSDTDRTYIVRIENGKANPTVKALYKIARALHIKISQLLIGV
ncbi:MAG: helix-turn-helix domain-containing protein [Patescibacteria group bacterium]|nr:helix-turn-helix domain-containing protein [Patescibacteria group bacterium]